MLRSSVDIVESRMNFMKHPLIDQLFAYNQPWC